MSPAAAGANSRRIQGVDAARGLALLGMMATHIFPLVDRGVGQGGAAEPSFVGLVFSGRSSALFAVLAGVGLALLTGGSRPHFGRALLADRAGIAVRAVLIGAAGLLLGSLNVNIAIILVHYAVLFLCALPFLRLRLPALACWAAGWMVVSPVLAFLLRPWALSNVPPQGVLGHNPASADLLQPWMLLSDIFLTGYYPVLQWLSYILVGLAVGRLDLLRTAHQLWLLAAGAAAAAGAKALSWLLMDRLGGYAAVAATEPARRADFDAVYQVNMSWVKQEGSWWWLGSASPHSGAGLDLLHTSGTAAVLLAVCLFIGSRWPALLAPLSGPGAMTLSLYSAHVWIMATVVSLGLPLARFELYWSQVVLMVVAGMLFQAAGWRGPLELVTSTASRAVRTLAAGRSRLPG
ncbi:heparan-alpha-glucosaminide N-acetyltransferase domain-containing protein [Arthrobacter sp. GCM10027362]|uniref:heparan-alpha-glucosaminide N-acetyltransferase domain-containing protein n=1 Tax=Arthrobacter sp. GCM10027362 TaxID=3273379 RepID=UPI003632747F